MATKAKEKDKDEAPAKKSGKGKLIVIIVVVLVLLLGAGGGAAWWFLIHEKAAKNPAKPVAAAPKPAHFISLQPFVTNVQSTDGQVHYVQVTIDLKAQDPKVDEQVTALMPEIRSAILNILAAQQAATVTQDATRDKLRAGVLAKVNQILLSAEPATPGKPATPPISGVYFSGFVMQ
ncbi:flagellar basal body-associated protein FliL [Thiomonas sp. FB-6]|uniref:flagellar basal body-associated FliL family protein n=1 Tax=Thiomonas sp. FB-6 TaxID=1158291 RepID=UPI000379672B|nr:flagellar basal body-associated FliL family protein [Thiomonas sp. FB-6]